MSFTNYKQTFLISGLIRRELLCEYPNGTISIGGLYFQKQDLVSISANGKVVRFLGNGVILGEWVLDSKDSLLVYADLLKYFFNREL